MKYDPAPTTPDPDSEDTRSPFERFEDLVRRVVAVPKSEIDNKRREAS